MKKYNYKFISVTLLILVHITACTQNHDQLDHKKKETAETVNLLNYYVKQELKKDSIILFETTAKYTSILDLEKAVKDIGDKKLNAIDLYREAERNKMQWSKELAPMATILTEKNSRKLRSPVVLSDYTTVLGDGFYRISPPLYSKDFRFAMLYSEYVCGSRCGEGKMLLFRKDNNIWKLIKTYNSVEF